MPLKMSRAFCIMQIIFCCYTASLNAGPASDPCSGTTCGKGAECRYRSNLVVCICPDSSEGDPFVECKTPSSTTENVYDIQQFSTTENNISPNFEIFSTVESTSMGQQSSPDDLSVYFPSAPPTLSHYAHAPPFSQQQHLIPPPPSQHVNGPYQFNQHLNRERPQNTFHGTVNPDPHQPSVDTHLTPSHAPTQHQQSSIQENDTGDIGFHIPEHMKTRISAIAQADRNSESLDHQHRNNNQNFPNNYNQILSSQVHNRRGPSPSQFSNLPLFNQQQQGNTPFNLHQDSDVSNRQEMVKDPLGIYVDCITINNRVVCADASSKHDLQQIPLQQQTGNQGFEHRLIAVGNENGNNFHPLPPPRLDGFSTAIKMKPSPIPERPHFVTSGFHHSSGPQGTVNLFPVPASSTSKEVQSEGSKVKVEYPVFSEGKPHAPTAGSDEAKLCKQMCGEGAICRMFHGRPICGCPEGHTGDPAKKCYPEPNSKFDPNSCQRHTECSATMICLNSQCSDPCLIKNTFDTSNISSFHDSLDAASNKNDNMCGPNAKCSVIEHIPLCSCEQNYFGNPYVGCVP